MATMNMRGHPGSWARAWASFAAMWMMMVVPMMLPSLIPTLWSYRGHLQQLRATNSPRCSVGVLGLGYFAVWGVVGIVVFPVTMGLRGVASQWPVLRLVTPYLPGGVLCGAGVVQFTTWKARQLAGCRIVTRVIAPEPRAPGCQATGQLVTAWWDGVLLGVRCNQTCVGWTMVMLATGLMNPAVMGLMTVAITAERVARHGIRIARITGVITISAGLALHARAIASG